MAKLNKTVKSLAEIIKQMKAATKRLSAQIEEV